MLTPKWLLSCWPVNCLLHCMEPFNGVGVVVMDRQDKTTRGVVPKGLVYCLNYVAAATSRRHCGFIAYVMVCLFALVCFVEVSALQGGRDSSVLNYHSVTERRMVGSDDANGHIMTVCDHLRRTLKGRIPAVLYIDGRVHLVGDRWHQHVDTCIGVIFATTPGKGGRVVQLYS